VRMAAGSSSVCSSTAGVTTGSSTANNYRAQLADKRRRELEQQAATVDLLPTTFAVPMHILRLHRSGNAGMNDFAQAIGADPGLAGKVLALVNSAAFKPASRVTRMSQAVSMIGMKNLLPLVFGFSLAGIFNKLSLPAAERGAMWKASLLKAVTARELTASAPNLPPAEAASLAEEAFLCALLQDIALPVIYASDRSAWPQITAILQLDNPDERCDREKRVNGIDHAELGGAVGKTIGLPQPFCQAIAVHHCGLTALNQALESDPAMARALDLASLLPHKLAQLTPQTAQMLALRLRTSLGLSSPAACNALLKQIGAGFGQMLQTFGEADESSVAFREFLQALSQEIATAMESAVSASKSEISELKQRELELLEKVGLLQQHVVQADYDELTGALNRRGFFTRASRILSLVREYERPCMVGFVDMDDFKTVNDTHGHAAGDAVLAAASKRIRDAVASRGIVGRIGGDEFAVLVVGADEQQLLDDQNRITQDLASFVVTTRSLSSPQPLPLTVTASVGLEIIGIPSSELTIDALLRRADERMYAQKRNRRLRRADRAVA
ncbi:MAG TPA: HDOD domain-containing protein, partial [Tepidisphaeraceae bacterium]|nr:HDOD domain-containing protein [Tepidisphaeraceae bacterium]